jgi:hypothetical protein
MSKKQINTSTKVSLNKEEAKAFKHELMIPLTLSSLFMLNLLQCEGGIEKATFLTPEEKEVSKKRSNRLLYLLSHKIITGIKTDFINPPQIITSVTPKELPSLDLDTLFNDTFIRGVFENTLDELRNLLPKTHTKQPRTLLKTISKNLKRDTNSSLDLFTVTAEEVEAGSSLVIPPKEEMNKNTGALALYLMELYQIQGNKKIVIENLEPMAKRFNIDNFRLKHYLWNLGGHVWPVVDKNEEGGLDISNQLLFKVKFSYSETVANKYEVVNNTIIGANRYGNNFLSFLANEPVKCIEIEPCDLLIKALAGKGLGNILTATDKFLDTVIRLSDIGVKLLTYSTSNKPNKKINEDSLINDLGLNEQLRTQGRPRIRQSILNGLEELKQEGHFIKYSFDEVKKIYEWTYGSRITKYQPTKKELKIEVKQEPKEEE